MKPIVGITAEITDDGNHFLRPVYAKAIIQAGGIPLLIPLVPEEHIGTRPSPLFGVGFLL